MIHTLRILFVVMYWLALPAYAARDVEESTPAAAHGHVQVSNTSGDLDITGWDKLEIRVRGKLGRSAELKFVKEGDHTTVKVVKEGSGDFGSSDLEVFIPQGSELTVNGVSSDIEIRNVHGVQRIHAVSGEVVADVFEGDIEVKTVSGDIQINGHGGDCLVTITSLSGDNEIYNVAGEIESTTVSGDMEIRAGLLTRARLKATNGDIDVRADLASGGRFESETISGDVELELTNGADLNVDIETFNGGIDNCFGLESTRKSEYGPGRILRFDRGAGDRRVHIKTMNGDVDICSK